MSSPSPGRTNNFDSLRLFFAVLVIFSHSYPLGRGSNATEPLHLLTRGEITLGNLSVWSFFAISGFLITQSWVRSPSPIKFLKKRAARIYPGFIVAALLMALFVVPIAADPHVYVPVSLQSFLLHTLRLDLFDYSPIFMHNVLPGILNGSLWSIPFEFWCYIGVLLLGLTGMFRRRYFIVAVFLGVIAFRLYLAITGGMPGGKILGQIFGFPLFWAMVLPFFLAGMLFHLYGGRNLLRTPLVLLAGTLIVASGFLPHGLLVTLPICWTYILMWLAYLPALHPLNLGRYGDFSYGVYLYAFSIEQLIVMGSGGHMTPLKLFALATPASLAVGALSWFLVERHFLSQRTQLKHEGKDAVAINKSVNEAPRQKPSAPAPLLAEEAYAELKR
jgi:peptidoglycan/LPS O-acetylase OafA/YrhL